MLLFLMLTVWEDIKKNSVAKDIPKLCEALVKGLKKHIMQIAHQVIRGRGTPDEPHLREALNQKSWRSRVEREVLQSHKNAEHSYACRRERSHGRHVGAQPR